MLINGCHLGCTSGSSGAILNFVEVPSRTIHAMFALNWLTGARSENFYTFLLIAFYDKTMSADGGHLEFPIVTKNMTFVEVNPMTIHAMFALNWFTGFKEDIFKTPKLKLCRLMAAIHLEFPIGTKNITFAEVNRMIIHAMFALNWFTGFRRNFLTFSQRVLCLNYVRTRWPS